MRFLPFLHFCLFFAFLPFLHEVWNQTCIFYFFAFLPFFCISTFCFAFLHFFLNFEVDAKRKLLRQTVGNKQQRLLPSIHQQDKWNWCNWLGWTQPQQVIVLFLYIYTVCFQMLVTLFKWVLDQPTHLIMVQSKIEVMSKSYDISKMTIAPPTHNPRTWFLVR